MDFGAAIKFAFDDKDWWKTCLVVGLFSFIPVLGIVAMFGWQRRVFDQIRAGQPTPLPAINFGEDLKRGVAPIVAVLNIGILLSAGWVVLFVVSMIGTAIDESLGAIAMGLGALVLSPMALIAGLLTPDFIRRAFVDDEMFPILKIGPTLATIKADFGGYVMVYLGLMVGNMLGGIGAFLCGVGSLVTSPWGMCIAAHIMAQHQTRLDQAARG